jgi:plastocyanin
MAPPPGDTRAVESIANVVASTVHPLRRLLALAAVLLVVAGCGASRDEGTGQGQSGTQDSSAEQQEAAAKADVKIDMKNIKYLPAAAKAKVGDTIVWTNSDSLAHTVTKRGGPGPNFDSGTIPPGGTYTLTVRDAGKIDYVCTIHPNQTGTLTVQ